MSIAKTWMLTNRDPAPPRQQSALLTHRSQRVTLQRFSYYVEYPLRRPIPCDNVGHKQALRTEFDLLTFVDIDDINVYFEKLRDYQYNLDGTTLAISDAALVSKVLSTLPLTWRSQIRHVTDTGTATCESIEKYLRNIQAEQAGSKPTSRAFAVS